jgi:hypothetical protein
VKPRCDFCDAEDSAKLMQGRGLRDGKPREPQVYICNLCVAFAYEMLGFRGSMLMPKAPETTPPDGRSSFAGGADDGVADE